MNIDEIFLNIVETAIPPSEWAVSSTTNIQVLKVYFRDIAMEESFVGYDLDNFHNPIDRGAAINTLLYKLNRLGIISKINDDGTGSIFHTKIALFKLV